MEPIVILGAGGHARSVAGVAVESLQLQVLAFVDVHSDESTIEKIAGIQVHPGKTKIEEVLARIGAKSLVLSIGDNVEREKIYEQLKGKFHFPNLISSTAIIKKSVVMGEGNVFLDQVYIGPNTAIGNNNLFNTRALVEHECVVGSSNHLAPASVLLGRVKMGDRNFIGSSAVVKQNLSIASDVTVGATGFVSRSIDAKGIYVGAPVIQKGES